MLAAVPSATLDGIVGRIVRVEVHVGNGLPGYSLVGLPDAAARESKDRVRAAMLSSGLTWPNQRITVNLAPATVRKTGPGLELAIALGILGATDALEGGALGHTAVLGELGLDGSVRALPGVLALADVLHRAGVEQVIVPAANAREAGLVGGLEVRCARRLDELRACLVGEAPWPDPPAAATTRPEASFDQPDLAEVRGLTFARTAAEIAAAGGHHLLFVGPPGVGKTMLARRIPTILPPLSADAALEVTRIHSVAGVAGSGELITGPPLRAPHHTASTAALVGGGNAGRLHVGELTLAHRGVLFLDELGEFAPAALDALRQPLEDRVARIARLGASCELPADFLLVACSNPCPCGLSERACRCSEVQKARYRRRLSGPLLDRFDLRVAVNEPAGPHDVAEPSAAVRERVDAARARQARRYRRESWSLNAHLPPGALSTYAPLTLAAERFLLAEMTMRRLSARGATRLHRVARTVADLDDRHDMSADDLALASHLRADVP